MPRRLRCNTGGYAYHVLNRAVGRAALFHKDDDYAAFETVLRQAKEQQPVRLLAYTLMPNHGARSCGRSATATCRNSYAG
jgi:putative transposase